MTYGQGDSALHILGTHGVDLMSILAEVLMMLVLALVLSSVEW